MYTLEMDWNHEMREKKKSNKKEFKAIKIQSKI